MSIPTYDQFIDPLLRLLAIQKDPIRARDAHEGVAELLGLTAEQRQETVAAGQSTYQNRCGWAHDRLKRCGYSTSQKRGYWQLTQAGLKYANSMSSPLPASEVRRIATTSLDVRLGPIKDDGNNASEPTEARAVQSSSPQSPDEQLDDAIREIRASVIGDLLDLLLSASPTFFEAIVLDVLHNMGYGASKASLQRVGGSNDGGIDGIISLDKLGLEKVYIQAKRWQGSVGRPEIQAFFGALRGLRANKGVVITTSSFSTQAVRFAASVEGIVLVDGQRLAALMIDHGVGVSVRQIRIPKIDSDYFDE